VQGYTAGIALSDIGYIIDNAETERDFEMSIAAVSYKAYAYGYYQSYFFSFGFFAWANSGGKSAANGRGV